MMPSTNALGSTRFDQRINASALVTSGFICTCEPMSCARPCNYWQRSCAEQSRKRLTLLGKGSSCMRASWQNRQMGAASALPCGPLHSPCQYDQAMSKIHLTANRKLLHTWQAENTDQDSSSSRADLAPNAAAGSSKSSGSRRGTRRFGAGCGSSSGSGPL